jgi:hypothetical protein
MAYLLNKRENNKLVLLLLSKWRILFEREIYTYIYRVDLSGRRPFQHAEIKKLTQVPLEARRNTQREASF